MTITLNSKTHTHRIECTIYEAHEYDDELYGFCTKCGMFEPEIAEPDAEGYECEECGEMSVMGFAEALFQGHVIITGD